MIIIIIIIVFIQKWEVLLGIRLLRKFGQAPYEDSGCWRAFDSSILFVSIEGWNSQAHREFPGKFEPSNLRRDNLSREIGRLLFWGGGRRRRLPKLTDEIGAPDPD